MYKDENPYGGFLSLQNYPLKTNNSFLILVIALHETNSFWL